MSQQNGESRFSFNRRQFLRTTASGIAVVGSGALFNVSEAAKKATSSAPESTVKHLFASLSEEQKKVVAFDWDYQKKGHGLLRTHVNNNWNITNPDINSKFFTADQQEMIRTIFEGIIHPDWHKRYYTQIEDDCGGFGDNQSIAIFGTPGEGKFEFVMTGRHLTLRCDGNSSEHVAFGGPIFYGHAARGFNEEPTHPGNVFWEQAVAANRVYQMLDGKQRAAAEIKRTRREGDIAFRGSGKQIPGLPVTELSDDQKTALQKVLQKLIEPYRQSDQDEVSACLKKQGGLDACSLSFYTDNDIGKDKVWDNWRLEGPAFVWHFRGAPHVHVWVNVADSAEVATNSPFLLRNRS